MRPGQAQARLREVAVHEALAQLRAADAPGAEGHLGGGGHLEVPRRAIHLADLDQAAHLIRVHLSAYPDLRAMHKKLSRGRRWLMDVQLHCMLACKEWRWLLTCPRYLSWRAENTVNVGVVGSW